MSFISHMVASLKHNKRERISAFEKIKNFKKGNNFQVTFHKKATANQLKKIREKLTSENRKRKLKYILVFAVGIISVIYCVGFLKF